MDIGIIIDLETSGIDPEKDKIIEIGLLEFAVGGQNLPAIAGMYSALQDPGVPLSEEIINLTGITDEILNGQKIDWDRVADYFARASIAIAHNAVFDRAFMQKCAPINTGGVHWGCSMRHIDWSAHGYRTRNLNYLAADHGFINPFAHRALFDCASVFRLITPHLEELILNSYRREFEILAKGAPFKAKDKLKAHGYRWDAERKSWYKRSFENELDQERAFLNREIYQNEDLHEEKEVSLNQPSF